MSDNSPEKFCPEDYESAARFHFRDATTSKLLRSAATLARELQGLKDEGVNCSQTYLAGIVQRAESAESSNRALQAEVDKLREKLMALIAVLPDTRKLLIAREDAIAATGHEP